jgi:DNA mismatch repair protein MutL
MDECDNPSHCPHGRPTWIRWTQSDLEKAFGRQG